MQVNSFSYLLFLAAAVGLYWFLKVRFRRWLVLVASLGFYATWGLPFVILPIFLALFTFLVARSLINRPAQSRRLVMLGVGGLLAALAFFKYRNFLLLNLGLLGAWIGTGSVGFLKAVALPAGISFYTFEAIAYLLDVRQGRVKPTSFIDLLLLFLFWPIVLSGPIVRGRELIPQLGFAVNFEPRFVFEGMDRLVWGLVQKNVIANVLAIWVDKGFHAGSLGAPATGDSWFLAIAFGLQIYFDFAGYSNMAIGAARLLGITLPENFRQPYTAGSPPEFWARWHMSLSRWIRDYLFFPMNAKWKGARLPLYASLIAVMTLVGLWHGAGWNFVLWGFLHGIYLVLYRVYEPIKNQISSLSAARVLSFAWRVATLVGVTAAWVPFRASNLHQIGSFWSSMFTHFVPGHAYPWPFYATTVLIGLFCAAEPDITARLSKVEDQAGERGVSLLRVLGRPVAYTAGFLLFMLFDAGNTQFIYSQF